MSVVGDTSVFLGTGMSTVGELHAGLTASGGPDANGEPQQLLLGMTGYHSSLGLYADGKKPARRVVTELGHSLTCSTGHSVLARAGGAVEWIPVGELTRGRELALLVGARSFGVERELPGMLAELISRDPERLRMLYGHSKGPPVWTRELARLAGHVRAGTASRQGRLQLAVSGHRMAREINRVFAGLMCREAFDGLRYTGSSFVCHSNEAETYLRSLLLATLEGDGGLSRCLRAAPMDIVLSFVTGLFLNGAELCQDEEEKTALRLKTTDERLLREIQLCLLNAGIIAGRTDRQLVLCHRSLKRLCELTPELLLGVGSWVIGIGQRRTGGCQKGVSAGREQRAQAGASTGELEGTSVRELARGVSGRARNRAALLLSPARAVWTRVEQVSSVCEFVYELRVRRARSFCADGFITRSYAREAELAPRV